MLWYQASLTLTALITLITEPTCAVRPFLCWHTVYCQSAELCHVVQQVATHLIVACSSPAFLNWTWQTALSSQVDEISESKMALAKSGLQTVCYFCVHLA